MQHPQRQIAAAILQFTLPLALGFAFLLAIYLRFYSGLVRVQDLPAGPAYTAYFVLSIALWSALETRFQLIYKCCEPGPFHQWLWLLAQLDLLTLAAVSAAAFFWRGYSFSRITVAIFWTSQFLLCALAGLAVRAWMQNRSRRGCSWLFLIGKGIDFKAVRAECLHDRGRAAAAWHCRRFPDVASAVEALRRIAATDCNEVLVVVSFHPGESLSALAAAVESLPAPGSIALYGALDGITSRFVYATPSFLMLSANPYAAAGFDYVFSKRLFDLLVSAAALAAAAPVMLAIAAIIWLRSGRPILLRQERVGRGGRHFQLYKFRSLPAASLADSDCRWTAGPTDGWGRFLRSTGLDELPQLMNVLRGQMSLVGPRPERPYFVEQFRRQLPFYSTRHRLQVGITGWAQVNGWRGDTSISRRVEHDLYYLRHWSLSLDFRILWMTLRDFLRRLWLGATAKYTNARSV
jgi:lipopolysaccharide/colanic/teichoic acid biosynthesis glycosyltransferase